MRQQLAHKLASHQGVRRMLGEPTEISKYAALANSGERLPQPFGLAYPSVAASSSYMVWLQTARSDGPASRHTELQRAR